MIDLGEDGSAEIVEVPEYDAPQRRSRERVRKPAAAVLTDVAAATVTVLEETPAASELSEAAPEAETEIVAAEPTADDQPAPSRTEGRKRRGWWSRAIGGS